MQEIILTIFYLVFSFYRGSVHPQQTRHEKAPGANFALLPTVRCVSVCVRVCLSLSLCVGVCVSVCVSFRTACSRFYSMQQQQQHRSLSCFPFGNYEWPTGRKGIKVVDSPAATAAAAVAFVQLKTLC